MFAHANCADCKCKQSVWHTWKVEFDLLGSVKLKLIDVQSQLLLVFSLHGDADVHVFARCMWLVIERSMFTFDNCAEVSSTSH
jgi:hypothetical protein